MKCILLNLFIASLLSISFQSNAGEYPVSAIPKALLSNANAVIRKEEQVIEIHSLNKVTIRDHYVITILNEAGESYAYWSEYYSKLRSIRYMEGALFDASGNKIRTVKKSEIKDEPVASEVNMIDDYRSRYHNFYHKEFPYTVEYESEITKTETMFLPNWAPVPGRNISVEQSSFSLITPTDYNYRHKSYNYTDAAVITTNGKSKTSHWSVKHLQALQREYASPPIHELAPYISFGPTDFKLDDYGGSMRSWEDYGRFFIEMNSGLVELPQSVKDKVYKIIAGATTDEDKVNRLYKYLQENTHYISIQLGVGGWRPFPAEYVADKGYGDCKALSNYMVALLKVAGIKANYVLIHAGDYVRDIALDFPASQFNHAICAVPMKNDTMWLECTNQTVPAGYMGSFTGNRHAFMITENGGKLVSTPRYDKAQNNVTGIINGTIDVTGNLKLNAVVKYQAECSDDLHSRIHAQSKEDQLKYLKRSLDLQHYDISEFSYQEVAARIPIITEQFKLEAPNYSQVTGKRLFITPNVLNHWDTKLLYDTARLYPVELVDDRLEIDSVILNLPAGYKSESIPKPVEIQTPFGKYATNVTVVGDQLIYFRRLALNRGKFPASDFNNLVKFYDQVFKSDRTKVVLVKFE